MSLRPITPAIGLKADSPYRSLVRVRLAHGEQAWLATRYKDVSIVLADARFSRSTASQADEPRARPHYRGNLLMQREPPDHTRLRRSMARAFSARQVERLRQRTRQIADELLTMMEEGGPPADVLEAFAVPLAAMVSSEVVGVPFTERSIAQLRQWSDTLHSTVANQDEVHAVKDDVFAHVAACVEQRSGTNPNDLINVLMRAEDRITHDELVILSAQQYTAAYDSPAALLPNFLYVLLTHPGRWEQVRLCPELLPTAVEELLRYAPLLAVPQRPRYALADVELGNMLVRSGEPVLPSLSAANMDEEVFQLPRELNLARTPNPHLGLGHGTHYCLGAHLVRMQMQVALGALVERFPQLRLAATAQPVRWKANCFDRKLTALPVMW